MFERFTEDARFAAVVGFFAGDRDLAATHCPP